MDADLDFPIVRPDSMTGLEWVDWIERCNNAYKRAFLEKFNLLWMAEDLAEGRPGRHGVQVRDRRFYMSAQLTAGDYAIHLLWKRRKIVYDVDPTLQESLADMESTDVLPGDILRQLPHSNPLFIWPAGHAVASQNGEVAIIRAMYVNGRTADKSLCSTHDPEAASYQLTFVSDLMDDEGRVITPDSVRMSFGLKSTATSIRKIVEDVLKDFAWEPLTEDRSDRAAKMAYMQSLVRFGVAHLLYTCADKADIDRPVASRTVAKGKNKGRPTKEAVLAHPLGWHIGPAIRSARERAEREDSSLGGTGRTVKPHPRRAHLHTFLHGPGRTLSKVKWLPPIFVNANGQAHAPEGTVVRVTG